MKFKSLSAVLAGAALSLLASTAVAVPITTAGLSITVGDKTFSGFTCNIVSAGTFSGPSACSSIDVSGLGGDPLGLRFQSAFFASSSSAVDILLGYTVTVNDPAKAINAIDLAFNGAFFGLAVTSVTETATNSGNTVGQVAVSNPPTILSATMPLTGAFSTLNIMKDILLAAGAGGLGTISFIDQRFHQIPEPGTLALVGLVLVGLGASRARRSRA